MRAYCWVEFKNKRRIVALVGKPPKRAAPFDVIGLQFRRANLWNAETDQGVYMTPDEVLAGMESEGGEESGGGTSLKGEEHAPGHYAIGFDRPFLSAGYEVRVVAGVATMNRRAEAALREARAMRARAEAAEARRAEVKEGRKDIAARLQAMFVREDKVTYHRYRYVAGVLTRIGEHDGGDQQHRGALMEEKGHCFTCSAGSPARCCWCGCSPIVLGRLVGHGPHAPLVNEGMRRDDEECPGRAESAAVMANVAAWW